MKRLLQLAVVAVVAMAAVCAFGQSGSTGSGVSAGATGGASQTCGFLPLPCMRQDLNVVPVSAYALSYGPTGNLGTVSVDPDFGVLSFRLTDSTAENVGFGCCYNRDSGELEAFSQVQPSGTFGGNGGYNVHVYDGSSYLLFGFDQKTYTPCQYLHGAGGCATSSGNGNPNGIASGNRITSWEPWSFSQVQPTVLYGCASSGCTSNIAEVVKYDLYQDEFYDSSGGTHSTPVAFVDFTAANCNLPTIQPSPGTPGGASYSARGDRYFSAVLGGTNQQYYLAVWEDTTTGNCYWQDTIHGLYGGTGISGSQSTTLGQQQTPLKPASLVPSTGGGAVNVCAVVTAVSTIVDPQTSAIIGQTVASPEITISNALLTDTITLTFGAYQNPWALPTPGCANAFVNTTPCRPYNVYMSENASGSCSGTEVLQTASPVSGPTWPSAAVSTLNGTSVTTPPLSSNAGFNIHQGNPNQNGLTMILANATGNSQLFLQPPNAGFACPGTSSTANAGCSGHAIPGVNKWINNNGVISSTSSGFGESIRPIINPTSPSSLVTCIQIPGDCTYAALTDQHSSWNEASDSAPMEIVNYFSGGAVVATFTNASASIAASQNYSVGMTVNFFNTGGGGLPSGFSAATTYYVISTGLSTSHFEVSATLNGSAITAGSAGTGVQHVQQVGNGALDFTNTCWNNQGQGWNGEILLQSTDGSGTVYRAGHHRAGACYTPFSTMADAFVLGNLPVGQISQDGKFALYSTMMGGVLGSTPTGCGNGSAYPGTTYLHAHTYTTGGCVYDGTNYEVVTSGSFVSCASGTPAWPITSGLTVNDNSGTCSGGSGAGVWEMNTGCQDPNSWAAGVGGESCRPDVFIDVLH